ncbi:YajG family lipoprotein [Vibrio sp. PP-XX7]
MKKLVIAASIALLSACSTPQQQQINFMPQATLSPTHIVDGKSFTLMSKDVRTAQYVALIDNGRANIDPIHANQNVRITIENALAQQFSSQGFDISVNSENSVTAEIQEALVSVKHSIMESEMDASVILEITAETPTGKIVKTYHGTAKKTSPLSASNRDIEMVFNDVVNLVLKKVANDDELKSYMKEHF